MLRAFTALVSLLLLLGTAAAQSGRHVALVVGIGEYRELRGIVRPAGDARAVHDRLTQLGFASELVVEPDGRALDEAFRRFSDSVQDGDVAVVYFSGHAGRVAGEFTLLAADAPPQGTRPGGRQEPFGLGITALADDLRVAGARAQILIVDACRGDPYAGAPPELGPSSCGELDQALPDGTFALFSAAAGQKALDRLGDDDRDPHSLFTRVLLARIDEGGSVVRLARTVRDEVSETALSVRYPQTPTHLDELAGPPVTLVPGSDDAAAARPAPRASVERAERAPAPLPPRERAAAAPADPFSCGSIAPGLPAFDCRRARRPAEMAICGDPRLGSCDRVLNRVFDDAQARAGREAAGLRREQDAWIARRDACAEAAPQGADAVADCIGLAYDERIAALGTPRAPARSTVSPSPSFNCRSARTSVEQAICDDPELAAKDRRMARLYERAGGSRFGPVDPTQRGWLAARDACGRAAGAALQACLHGAYDGRIRELGG